MKIKSLLLVVLFSLVPLFVVSSKVNAAYSIEIQEAYYWALSNHLTNLTPVDAAELDWVLTRQVMAKIISNFSINVLWMAPDTSRPCHFVDADIADGLLPHVITSCQLWLMWQWINRFNPYDVVTRAEFWTILSRIIWWDTYDKWKRHTFYERHLQALNDAWIIKNTDPARIELRGYVFIMLMRTNNMLKEFAKEEARIAAEEAKKAAEEAAKNATWIVEQLTWEANILSWANITPVSGSGVIVTWSNNTWTNVTWTNITWASSNWSWENTPKAFKQTPSAVSWYVKKEPKVYATYTFKTQDRSIYTANWYVLYWKLYQPNRDGKVPMIIYSHWLWSNYESWIPYAEELAKLWIAVYLFDFRWWWVNSKSEWLSTDMSVLTEKDDLEAVLREVESRTFVDKDMIFLWGASQWWLVTALVASTHSDIKWSILFFPAFSIPETVKSMFPNPDDIPDSYSLMSFMIWRKYATDIYDLDIYGEIAKDEKPVLIIHWTADSVVPISYSAKAHSTYKNSTYKKIRWWGHWFTWKDFNTSLEYIKDFLETMWAI